MKWQGLVKQPIPVGDPIPLTRDDLPKLYQGDRHISSVMKIRASHHRIARLCAWGWDNKRIAAFTGYTRERVGQLLGSPAMKELIATYMERLAEREAEQFDAYLDLKTQNMIAAERHIADRIADLDATGELLPVKTALAISADGADRTGYGKRQTNLNINADFGAALERAIKRSGSAKVVEAKAIPPLPAPSLLPDRSGAVRVVERPPIARRV